MKDQIDKDDTSPLGEVDNESEPSASDTLILPGSGYLRRLKRSDGELVDVHLGQRRQIMLLVRGLTQTIDLSKQPVVVLGRVDHKSVSQPDIDLGRFGAAERGVSREHARLEIQGDNLYLIDLNSTNGTFFKGARLAAGEQCLLRQADEFILGRLAVQVLFEG